MLKTIKTIPPGGWIFDQKTPTGTNKKFSTMVPFGEAVKGIVAYRKGNAIEPHDFESVAIELEQQTCARLGNNPKYCEVKKKALLDKINILPAHVKKAVELAGNATNGARILADWLGEGAVAVNRSLAQARANICLGCPENLESHGVMKLTDAIGAAILEQRRKKSDMELEVIGEPGLFTCNLCACHLPLKVWVPMKTIANRTHPKLVEKFPDFCWMKTETEKPKENRETEEHAESVAKSGGTPGIANRPGFGKPEAGAGESKDVADLREHDSGESKSTTAHGDVVDLQNRVSNSGSGVSVPVPIVPSKTGL